MRSQKLFGAVWLALAFMTWIVCPLPAHSQSSTLLQASTPRGLFLELDEFFERNPDMKTEPGSGWKPYNRIKWFHERRLDDDELPSRDARWKAWEHKRAIELSSGPRLGTSWFALGPANFGGRMLSIDFDATNPAIVYTGAAGGGVFKSTDSGDSWIAVGDGIPSMAVGGIGVSRTDPNIVVIGTGESTFNIDRVTGVGILRSTDAGSTWMTTNLSYNSSQGHGFHVVTAAPSGTFLAGAVDGLYRSTDDGATWTEAIGTVGGSFVNGWYDIQYDPENNDRVYAVKGNDSSTNGVYLSTDDGLTWSLSGTGQPGTGSFGKSKLGVSESTIYCYVGVQGFGGGVWGLMRSTDDGATWAQTTANSLPSGQSWYNLSCTSDPNNPNRVYCAAVSLSRSNDGGESFNAVDLGVHVDHHALKFEPGSLNEVWALSDGGAYRSPTNGGLFSWQDKNDGLVTYQFYDICVNNGPDPFYVMGGTQDNGTDKWSGTTTWANGLGADGMVCNIDPTNGTTVYAETQRGGHQKSTTSGTNFASITNGITGNGQWVTPVDEDQTDGDRLFTETSSGIFRTTNGGSNWQNLASFRADWISISPADPQIVWAIRDETVRRSTDGGDSWQIVSSFGFAVGNATKIIAHPADSETAFATFSTFGGAAKLARTTDGGSSWEDATGDLPNMPVNGIAVNPSSPGDWYLGTDLGVWSSTNDGVNWIPYGTGLPNVVVDDVEIKDSLQKLVAGTHGRGAWEASIATATSSPEIAVSAPRNLMLDEPWPNPVDDRTLLRYAAKGEAPVTLRIYDVRGRMIADLDSFSRGDGIIRTTPWFPDGVASGVYLAVLQAGSERITKKITLRR